MENSLFENRHELHVELCGFNAAKGTLIFGDGSIPSLKIQNGLSRLDLASEVQNIKVETHQGDVFTLCQCRALNNAIYPSVIIKGDIQKDEVSSINVRMDVVSEWLNTFNGFECQKNSTITFNCNNDDKLNVAVSGVNDGFTISISHRFKTSKVGSIHNVIEWIDFSFEPLDGCVFGVLDVPEKVADLLRLFSVLIGVAVNVDLVTVCIGENKVAPVYFPLARNKKVKNNEISDYLVMPGILDDKWSELFNGYFNSDYKNSLWKRIYGMSYYTGFYEFEFVGYVVILDKYVSGVASSHNNDKIQRSLPKKLEGLLNNLEEKAPETCKADIDAIRKELSSKREKYFAEKYEFATSLADENVIRVINMSNEDFKEIKRCRDEVAHGEALIYSGFDISNLKRIEAKLKLLLRYFAYKEAGVGDIFMSALLSMHEDVRLADIDKKYRDNIISP